jgi:hypothetical protein
MACDIYVKLVQEKYKELLAKNPNANTDVLFLQAKQAVVAVSTRLISSSPTIQADILRKFPQYSGVLLSSAKSLAKPVQEVTLIDNNKRVKANTPLSSSAFIDGGTLLIIAKQAVADKIHKLIEVTFKDNIFSKQTDVLYAKDVVNKFKVTTLNLLRKMSDDISIQYTNPTNYRLDLADNPLIQFLSPEMTLHKNVADAIAIGSYSYMGTQGNSLSFNEPEVLRSMLKYGKDERLPDKSYPLYTIGKNINNVADTIGREILAVLGLKIKDEIDRKRMEHVLGLQGIVTLQRAGLLETTGMLKTQYESLFKGYDPALAKPSKETINFVTFPKRKNEAFKGTKEVETIFSTYKEDAKSFKEVFNTTLTAYAPLFKPVEKAHEFLKGSKQRLSAMAKKSEIAANSRPYGLNIDEFNIFSILANHTDPEVRDKLLRNLKTGAEGTGFVDPATVHIDKRRRCRS